MIEEWADVIRFPKYSVSTFGRVIGLRSDRILKSQIDRGYARVGISTERGVIRRSVHILVAETFLGIHPGLQVNHKDGNKLNNYLNNLEWVTASANVQHAYDNGLHGPSQGGIDRIAVRVIETGDEFSSISECARAIGDGSITVIQGISRALRRYNNSYNNLHFEVLDK